MSQMMMKNFTSYWRKFMDLKSKLLALKPTWLLINQQRQQKTNFVWRDEYGIFWKWNSVKKWRTIIGFRFSTTSVKIGVGVFWKRRSYWLNMIVIIKWVPTNANYRHNGFCRGTLSQAPPGPSNISFYGTWSGDFIHYPYSFRWIQAVFCRLLIAATINSWLHPSWLHRK